MLVGGFDVGCGLDGGVGLGVGGGIDGRGVAWMLEVDEFDVGGGRVA